MAMRRKGGRRRTRRIKPLNILIVVVLLVIISGFFLEKPVEDATQSPSPTPFNNHGFDGCWAQHMSRSGTDYYCYDQEKSIMVSLNTKGSSYHVRKTVGDLSSGLYEIDPSTGERSSSYYILNGSGLKYVYGEYAFTNLGEEPLLKPLKLLESRGYFEEYPD